MSKHERTAPAQGDFTGRAQGGGRPTAGQGHGGWHTTSQAGGEHRGGEGDALREIASLMEDPAMVRVRARPPKNYKRSDERIREEICERLMDDARVDSGDVSIEVRSGVVTLEGTVPEHHMKYIIEDVAADCFGADDIENRIRVSRSESGAGQQARDQNDPLVRQLADYGF